MDIKFVKFEQNVIDELLDIEVSCFKAPWTKQMFEEELRNEKAIYVIVAIDEKLVGYGGMWNILDEGYITNIAVHPKFQRKGIATVILKKLTAHANDNCIHALTLEVRKSNEGANLLYQKFGFLKCGERKRYYQNPTEDAWILWKNL